MIVGHDTHSSDYLGFAVGLDGDTVISGAYRHDEGSNDEGAAYIHILTPDTITPYCFGDGQGTPCPCSNDSLVGLKQGCVNSGGEGVSLNSWGTASVAADDLVIAVEGLIPNNPALLFGGVNAINGGNGNPFGDGLRCAGGQLKRLGVGVPDVFGHETWGPGISALGGWSGGSLLRFQVWYRDPLGPCSSSFNTTSGLEVLFTN